MHNYWSIVGSRFSQCTFNTSWEWDGRFYHFVDVSLTAPRRLLAATAKFPPEHHITTPQSRSRASSLAIMNPPSIPLVQNPFVPQPPIDPSTAAENAHIDAALAWIPRFWLAACEIWPQQRVTHLSVRNPSDVRNNGYKKMKEEGVIFYTMHRENGGYVPNWASEDLGELGDGVSAKEALLTFMKCQMGCFTLAELLQNILKGEYDVLKVEGNFTDNWRDDPYVTDVKWIWCRPKPKFVLFVNRSNDDEDSPVLHDAILLTTCSRRRFVLECSGAQFGIKGHLFTYENYHQAYMQDGYAGWEYETENIQEKNKTQLKRAETDGLCWDYIYLKNLAKLVIGEWERSWKSEEKNWGNIENLTEVEREEMFEQLKELWKACLEKALELRGESNINKRRERNFFPRWNEECKEVLRASGILEGGQG